ncbi:hypothetical protein SVAN01_05808 [Stagonosporopsis vannaccii]|nr:hypothetical protein SVAN01_05808 [Stagonosporopsis vannaccii]
MNINQILKGIFKFHEIKNSAPLLKYLAEEIGGGCTPKAVSHRLSNLRQSGKPVNPSTPRKTHSTAKSPRTPSSGRARASVKKIAKPEAEDTDEELDEELVSSPLVQRKRTRTPKMQKSYAESDASSGDDEDEETFVPQTKKVKAEPVEKEAVGGDEGGEGPDEEDGEGVDFV